jgi:hypothetical protein
MPGVRPGPRVSSPIQYVQNLLQTVESARRNSRRQEVKLVGTCLLFMNDVGR